MNKLQSLYFKLNPENPKHQYIIKFFDFYTSCEFEGRSKIDVLYDVCNRFDKEYANELYGK